MLFLKKSKYLMQFSKEAWRFYFTLFTGHRRKLIRSTLVAVAQTVIIIPSLLLVKYAFDVVIPGNNIRMLIFIGIAIFLLRLINSLISVSLRRTQIAIINQAIYNLRIRLLQKLYGLSYLFFVQVDMQSLHTRIVQDSERVINMSTALISRLLPSMIISLGLLIVCLVLNWYLLFMIVALFPLLVISNRMMGRRVKDRVSVFQRAFEEFSKGVNFVLRYMPLTTMQSAQDQELKRQESVLNNLREKTGRMADVFSVNLQLQETITGLTAIVIIIAGGISVAMNYMTLGDFLSFYLAAIYLNKHINTISSSIPDIIAGNVSLNTLYELESQNQIRKETGGRKIHFDGSIELKDVHFAYGETPVLRGLSLMIKPGTRLAIVGVNGSGKTTLLNLIAGLIEPVSGSVSASGFLYNDIDTEDLRKQIGFVTQHPQLFPGSIAENIVYGTDEVNFDQLRYVSKLAMAHDFISRLPAGYETQIGDDGMQLSGGEGQRIAIARALYRSPALLILDEPTNHLDHAAVESILQNLDSLEQNPAILMITHELNVMRFANEVYSLEQGVLKPNH